MNDELESKPACDPSLSRSQFIKLLIERATFTGALLVVPAIADSFMSPQAVAANRCGQVGTSLTFQDPLA